MYNFSEKINDTIPSYHIDNLPKRSNEALLEKTELSMKEDDSVMRKVKLKFAHHDLC